MCGIGGRTIAEAQQRMSWKEFVRWSKYRQMRGTLNLGMRLERGSALLASMYANRHRDKNTPAYDLYDFAPHHEQPEATLEEAMASWG